MWIKTFIKQLPKTYFKQLPKILCVLSIISILYILFYKIQFINQPEIFPYAEECGDVLYNLSLACIASFVFYYFSIHIREEKAKDETIWFLYKKLNEIIYTSRKLYKEIESQKVGDCFDYQLFKKDFSKKSHSDETRHCICENGSLKKQTFADLYYDIPIDIKSLITIIYIRAPFIEPKILNAFLEIEESQYMRRSPKVKLLNSSSLFTDKFIQDYIDFLKLIDCLEEYLKCKTKYVCFLKKVD